MKNKKTNYHHKVYILKYFLVSINKVNKFINPYINYSTTVSIINS